MEKQFVKYEIALALKELGFDEPCFGIWINRGMQVDVMYVAKQDDAWMAKQNEGILAPLWQQVVDWFREKHRFHIQITPISYLNYTKIAYFYNIGSDYPDKVIYDYQDKYGDVLDASTQEVPGNYLNDELYDKNIFDMDFAYKTHEECLGKAILKAIELCQKEGS